MTASEIVLPPLEPDWDGMLADLRREGTPPRVYLFEHGIAQPVLDALDERFGIWTEGAPKTPEANWDRHVAIHRYLGMEWFRVFPLNARFEIARKRGGGWVEEETGPIRDWESFEGYPWPDPAAADYSVLEHLDRRGVEGMRAFHVLDVWEKAKDLFGFASFCFALYEEPDLVDAVFRKVGEYTGAIVSALCDFESLGAIYIADDLGFKTSTFIPPDDLRRLVLPWHRRYAEEAHAHGKLFFLHSCGHMYDLIDDYIDDVAIDAKHSFEDAVLPVTEAKRRYGDRLSLLGGMDVDLLARADETTIRTRTREVLEACMPGGGYCLGSGNWITDYIPAEHYLWMLDEARRFA